jgi:dTDP-4-dehydrorhamnose reductase
VKVLLFGAGGQLSVDISRTWGDHDLVELSHKECDVTDFASVMEAGERHRPDVVIDNAAYVRVDDAETHPELAFAVNAEGAKNCADAAKAVDAAILYMSTDYVFGKGTEPHTEDEPVHPLGAYAISKAAGEALVRNTTERHFIVRSGGLFGHAGSSGKGGNFVETMLRFAREGRSWKVVADEVVSPTYTLDLAMKLKELVGIGAYGTYHLTNAGQCSWHEFAVETVRLAGLEAEISPTTSAEWNAPAPRPRCSVLKDTKTAALGLEPMRPWREALAAYLADRQEN